MTSEKFQTILSFEGLLSAPFNAFDDKGDLNLDVIPKYVDHLVNQGVKGVYVNGTTGEGMSLNLKERKDVAEAWVKHGKNKLEIIIIHISAHCMKDVQEMAAHAEKIGATGVMTLPPLFYRAETEEQLVEYFKQVSSAAPTLPLMLYHFPDFSQVELTLGTFLPKARAAIPNFIGAKFTSVDVRDLLHAHRLPEKFKVMSGYEEVLLPALSVGCTAAIGADYNFMAPLSQKIVDAYKKGDIEEARRYQNLVAEFHGQIYKHGQAISVLKAVMNLVGPIQFGQPRSPLLPLDSKALENLKKDLKEMKSEEWQWI